MSIKALFRLIPALILTTVSAYGAAKEPDHARQQELLHLLLADCGSCHGMTMNGGLGPALREKDLATKPDEYLAIIISEGSAGTPMPPWRDFLTDEEVRWMVDVLRDEKWRTP